MPFWLFLCLLVLPWDSCIWSWFIGWVLSYLQWVSICTGVWYSFPLVDFFSAKCYLKFSHGDTWCWLIDGVVLGVLTWLSGVQLLKPWVCVEEWEGQRQALESHDLWLHRQGPHVTLGQGDLRSKHDLWLYRWSIVGTWRQGTGEWVYGWPWSLTFSIKPLKMFDVWFFLIWVQICSWCSPVVFWPYTLFSELQNCYFPLHFACLIMAMSSWFFYGVGCWAQSFPHADEASYHRNTPSIYLAL